MWVAELSRKVSGVGSHPEVAQTPGVGLKMADAVDAEAQISFDAETLAHNPAAVEREISAWQGAEAALLDALVLRYLYVVLSHVNPDV